MTHINKHILFCLLKYFLLSFILMGCSSQNEIDRKLREMQSMPIKIPFSKMLVLNENEHIIFSSKKYSFPYSLIILIDSTTCTDCAISKLSRWNEYLNLEKEGRVQLLFIISPEKQKLDNVVGSYYESGLEHEIMVDTCGIFKETNPQIPEENLFHTFVIDIKGNVVLVGDPSKNPTIDKLFRRIIKNQKT